MYEFTVHACEKPLQRLAKQRLQQFFTQRFTAEAFKTTTQKG
jgi:hypothetical protein